MANMQSTLWHEQFSILKISVLISIVIIEKKKFFKKMNVTQNLNTNRGIHTRKGKSLLIWNLDSFLKGFCFLKSLPLLWDATGWNCSVWVCRLAGRDVLGDAVLCFHFAAGFSIRRDRVSAVCVVSLGRHSWGRGTIGPAERNMETIKK